MAVFRVNRNEGYTVMSNFHLRDERLTLKAKGLLSQMLSLPPDWKFNLRGLVKLNREKIGAISSAVSELENAGYVVRHQGRYKNGKMADIVYDVYEKPLSEKPYAKNPNTVKPYTDKPSSENPILLNIEETNTEEINTDLLNINPINQDGIDEIGYYRKIIYDNIDYSILAEQYDKEQLDELIEIMAECICSKQDTLVIGQEDVPQKFVKSRFLQINSSHIEYIFWCLKNNTTKVNNIKAYLKAVLYNAPVTISNFYAAEVNHDLYGG